MTARATVIEAIPREQEAVRVDMAIANLNLQS